MNILCKIFGHNLYYDTDNICGASSCGRWKCDYKRPAIKWLTYPVMPIIKQSKSEYDIDDIEKLLNEWLETLNDIEGYWDGVYASDKDIATKLIFNPLFRISFIDWLKSKEK